MSTAADPEKIYARAEEEGRRRLGMGWMEQISTAFIAGVTVVFGIVALGIVDSHSEPLLGSELARITGALAFGIGLVFLVVGRTELFSENFFDPVAAAVDDGSGAWRGLLRLWAVTLVFNFVGGAVLIAILGVDGVLPGATSDTLVKVGEEIAAKNWTATLASAVFAGALLTLLSYMLNTTGSVAARALLAYAVGFLVALGPFDHVVVSGLHLLYAVPRTTAVDVTDLLRNGGIATVGNIVGGVLLITLTHTAQVIGEQRAGGGK